MAGRYGGRFGTNQEQEQRRIQKEPVVVWKKDWVLPAGAASSSNVKILKWVRTGDVINFDEEEIGEETMAMDVDMTTAMTDPVAHENPVVDDSMAATPIPAMAVEESTAAMAPIVPQGVVTEGTPIAETPPPTNEPIPAETLGTVSTQAESQSSLSQQPLTQPRIIDSQEILNPATQQSASQLSEL